MANQSSIEWTDLTSNPIHLVREDGSHGGHWCRKISEGCTNCYAEALNQNRRYRFSSLKKYEGLSPVNLILDTEVMKQWITMKTPKRIFVSSMTDVFGQWISDEWLDEIFAYMVLSKSTFLVLTKRAKRMQRYFRNPDRGIRIDYRAGQIMRTRGVLDWHKSTPISCPLPNVWLGVTVEDQVTATGRIHCLLDTPATGRFLSCEPLLEEVDLRLGLYARNPDWVIVGGESGNKARTTKIDHLLSVVLQCRLENVPVFTKQLGSHALATLPQPSDYGYREFQTSDRKGGIFEEFPPALQFRQFPDFW